MSERNYDIRVLGLDLDGTVFDDQKNISARNRAAIAAAIAKGVVVLPATGRPLSGVAKEFLEIPGVQYALTSNGASIVRLADRSPFLSRCISSANAARAFEVLAPIDCLCDVYVEGRAYTTRAGYESIDRFVVPALQAYVRATRIVVDDFPAFVRESHDRIEKFSVMFDDADLRLRTWKQLNATGAVRVVSSVPHNIELNAIGVDKGSSLLALAEKLGFGPENVMACGDSGNDVDLLQKVGLGVAMANADPEVKAVADALTAGNNDDGVALAIEKFVL